ncbi:hypothetical protein GCM10025857_37000 [Alicyclobacillus contaminans]|nr:hypothetical protein GCM10025857_37000 [Alicyclobacillus contaminans]
MGKVIGAGMPVGAYGGRRDIMALVAPDGPVYQAGTLSGNPLAMAAGIASLEMLRERSAAGLYDGLQAYGERLVDAFVAEGKRAGIPVSGVAIGGMFGLFFHEGPIVNYRVASQCDSARYAQFFHLMLERGVAFAPSQLESGFLSAVHGQVELDQTVSAIQDVFRAMTR